MLVSVLGLITTSASQADDALFRDHIAPLLEKRCLACHNSDDRKGGFSLQTAQELRESGMIEPGNPEQSEFLKSLVAEPGHRPAMPKDGTPLTTDEIEMVRRWIGAGSNWPSGHVLKEPVISDFDWWSFKPLSDAVPPTFSDADDQMWIRTPVDAFILSELKRKNLTPSPEADRRTLIRRLSFDLLGLPPAPDDVEQFVNNTDPMAWEKLVDRCLNSPHYGERWARHWLDVVRYADTCGYDKDKLRPNAWPYRDYVIQSLNADKPYSRFVQEQIAGDVLFPGDPDGILGLGFIAAGPWDFIGHVEVPETKIDGKVARNLDRDDMVTGTLNTFCSVTIQCARCHNHKFDPFTQHHYYGLQAVFAAVDRADRRFDTDPVTEQKRSELTERLEQVRGEQNDLEAAIRAEGGEVLQMLTSKIAELAPIADAGQRPPEYGYHSQIAADPTTLRWVQVDLGETKHIQRVILHPCSDDYAGIGAGFGFPVRFRVDVASGNVAPAELSEWHCVLDNTTADVVNPGLSPVEVTVDASVRFVRVTATRLVERSRDYIFALSELEAIGTDGTNTAQGCTVDALDSIEAPARWEKSNLTDGLWPVSNDPKAAAELAKVRSQHQQLMSRLVTPEREARRKELAASVRSIEAEIAALPTGRMVYAAATEFPRQGNFIATQGVPRPVRLLHRGQETQPRDEAIPGAIPLTPDEDWLFHLPEQHPEGARRAALAQWITKDSHPLTWRSIVNRVWQYHFGAGLVETANDFGRMGQKPTHPELLDWLAREFLRDGQSLKSLHRLIVLSSTYRQSSETRNECLTVDGDNRLLWRMNRRRLEAEEIRDTVLAVSGRLNTEMGGPGFYLFELEKTDHSPHYEYHKFDPDDVRSHRRSVYRFIVRSQPDPFMTTLDCADSSQSTPRRHETLTALQALSLMNNRFTTSMAQHFAERLQREAPDAPSQVERGFRLTTGRSPSLDEQRAMEQYVQQHGLPALCRLLLNLNEFVFVD